MTLHIYDNKTGNMTVMENVVHAEEKESFWMVHTQGEKWFDQILINKADYCVFVEQ